MEDNVLYIIILTVYVDLPVCWNFWLNSTHFFDNTISGIDGIYLCTVVLIQMTQPVLSLFICPVTGEGHYNRYFENLVI